MTDCIRVQDGKAAEIFGGKTKSELVFTAELMAAIIEVATGSVALGDLYNGATFTPPPPQVTLPNSRVDGVTFLGRVQDAEYAAIVAAAASNVQLARWIDQIRILGYVNVASDAAVAAKAALVAANLLTGDRAAIIFASL